jgi:hypothetical protein
MSTRISCVLMRGERETRADGAEAANDGLGFQGIATGGGTIARAMSGHCGTELESGESVRQLAAPGALANTVNAGWTPVP